MKTTHAIAIVLGIVCGVVLFFVVPRMNKAALPQKNGQVKGQQVRVSTAPPAPKELPAATSAPVQTSLIPARLRIPKINVDAEVEKVGNDDKGRMDVPKGVLNTAWYEPGYKPGMTGAAVIAAHFDTPSGGPGPFYDIGKLEPGDTVEVEGEDGKTLTFEVVDKQKHKDAAFPIQEVFLTKDKPRLNLITCSGTWDSSAKNYSDRLVVYTVLKD